MGTEKVAPDKVSTLDQMFEDRFFGSAERLQQAQQAKLDPRILAPAQKELQQYSTP